MSTPLMQVAEEIYDKNSLSPKAVKALKKKLCDDKTLLDLALERVAYDLLRAVQQQRRVEIQEGGTVGSPDPKPSGRNGFKPRYTLEEQLAAVRTCGSYLKWPLWDGTFLGKATRDLVLKNAERYQSQALGNFHKAQFLRRVAEGLEDGQKVSDVYTDEELATLYREAQVGVSEEVV